MKIVKIIYLTLNIFISFFTVIFLSLNNLDLINIRYSFSQNILYYFACNSILGIILTIRNRNNKEKIKLRWFIPSIMFLFLGLAYVGFELEHISFYLSHIKYLFHLIILLIIYTGHFFYEKEIIRIYNKNIIAKIFFGILYPISVVIPMLSCLAISTI